MLKFLSVVVLLTKILNVGAEKECIITLIKAFFPKPYIFINQNGTTVDSFFSTTWYSDFVIYTSNENISIETDITLEKIDQYLIVGNEWDTSMFQIDALSVDSRWNPGARFIFLTHRKGNNVSQLFETFWNRTIVTFLVVAADEIYLTKSRIPNDQIITKNCEHLLKEDLQLGDIDLTAANPYEMAVTANVEKHSLSSIILHIVKIIFQREKIAFIISKRNSVYFWEIVKNSSVSESMLTDMRQFYFSLFLSGTGLSLKRYKIFDVSPYMCPGDLYWLVPYAELQPQWKNIILIFDKRVWLAILGIIIVIFATIYIIFQKCITMSTIYGKSIIESLFISLRINLGQNIPTLTHLVTFKILCLSWILYKMHIDAAFQGNLISVLTQPIYEKQINSEKDILVSGQPIYAYPAYLRSFHDYFEHKNTRIFDRKTMWDWKVIRIALPADIFLHSFDGGKLKVLDQAFATSFNMLLIKKGHPIRRIFEKWVLRVHASGFSAWLFKNAKDYFTRRGRHVVVQDHVKISIAHVQVAFYFWIVGLLISIIIFYLERYIFQRCFI